MAEVKTFMILDAFGLPIPREGDEANPYKWHSLIYACEFAKTELKNQVAVSVVEVRELERLSSGM